MNPEIVTYTVEPDEDDYESTPLVFELEMRTTAHGETAMVQVRWGPGENDFWDIEFAEFNRMASRFQNRAKRRRQRLLNNIEALG